ncbi:lytic transglycosylase domain-containing protein [Castellaniella sp. UC4442_H9]
MLAEFAALAMACAPQVHVTTMQALVQAESHGNPYAIRINGKGGRTLEPADRAQATALAQAALRRGENIDAGWGQINSSNWKWLGLNAENVFDPCTNLRAAQVVLTDCYERAAARLGPGAQALVAGLSCYNTGNFRGGVANGYVQGVYAQANVPVPAIRGDSAPSVAALPPLPTPLPGLGATTTGAARAVAPGAAGVALGIQDGFSSDSIPDGFESQNRPDGFVDPKQERTQHIGLPSVSGVPAHITR